MATSNSDKLLAFWDDMKTPEDAPKPFRFRRSVRRDNVISSVRQDALTIGSAETPISEAVYEDIVDAMANLTNNIFPTGPSTIFLHPAQYEALLGSELWLPGPGRISGAEVARALQEVELLEQRRLEDN
jgi:hypothetical protein